MTDVEGESEEPPGRLIASGRAADVFDLGDGTVLRRYRSDHDSEPEGRLMGWLVASGVPVPVVHRATDRDLVMDHVSGPSMLDDLQRRPWRLRRHARTLAALQRSINDIVAPDWLSTGGTVPDGSGVVHGDLHPMNVILGPAGPVVIDFTNATRGPAAFDAAMSYVLMSSFETSGAIDRLGQRLLVAAFRRSRGRHVVDAGLVDACRFRLADANVTVGERKRVERLLARDLRHTDLATVTAMEMHFATVWESIADAISDLPAITHGPTTRSWAEYDERAARVAGALDAAGLGPGTKVSLFMYNSNEFMESQFGVFKMRGVPINVNYRYLDDELWYLLDNSDSEAIIFHSSLGDRVARVVERLPKIKLLIEVDDGGAGQVPNALAYDDVIATNEPMERIERAEDDLYMLYTGGTTGMPKGVMYDMGGLTRAFVMLGFPILGLVAPSDASAIAPMIAGASENGSTLVSIPAAPLMHGTGCWLGWFIPHLAGGHVVTLESRSLDPHELLRTVERHRVTSLTIVGDSFAKPIIRALDEGKPDGTPYDTSSIGMFISSGVMWTSEVKQQILDRIEQAVLVDAIGSSEGSMGTQITMKGLPTETATFSKNPETKVFTDDDREVEPGSDEVGMVAAGGNVPIGYYKDEEKSARTFRVINGVRFSFPGDFAKVAADGSLILLGRGSQVINTGGEKVFPEEVEEAVKRVDGVRDCLVVGVENEKFGQAVTAVVSLEEGASIDSAGIIASVKSDLAGYKAPKSVIFVDQVPRAPNGKADYRSAKQHAEAAG